MKTKKIKKELSLEQLNHQLNKINSEKYSLYFDDDFEIGLIGYCFDYNNQIYQVADVLYEGNEIPLLDVIRIDASEFVGVDDGSDEIDYNDDLETCLTQEMGYYTKDEQPYYMPSEFNNHTKWSFQPGGKYSWNIPGIPNHTLIGFYWVPLTSVHYQLYKKSA